MPTVLRHGSYRFYFYSSDRSEPPHVHVRRGECLAKIWLEPVRLEHSSGYGQSELTRIFVVLLEHHHKLIEAWNAFFSD